MRGKFNLRMHYSIFVYNVQDYFQIFSYFLIFLKSKKKEGLSSFMPLTP